VIRVLPLKEKDRLLGMLPLFCHLNWWGRLLCPPIVRLPTLFFSNPTEGSLLAAIALSYKVSLFIGTSTFLAGIAGAVNDEKLNSIRITFTGAEKC